MGSERVKKEMGITYYCFVGCVAGSKEIRYPRYLESFTSVHFLGRPSPEHKTKNTTGTISISAADEPSRS